MKIFTFLFRLVLLVGLVYWLADRPGTAHIEWRDTVFDMTAAVLVVIIAAIAYGFMLLNQVWNFIWDGPRIWRLGRKIGKLEDGQKELAEGFTALASGHSALAGKHGVKARKMLGETPMTRLLMAQTAQLAGDTKAARLHFQSMIGDPESAVLGYRGLITMALKEGQLDEVLRLTAHLEAAKADVPWLNLVRFETASRLENWGMASTALQAVQKNKMLPAAVSREMEGVLLLAQAKTALREGRAEQALELAEKSRKFRPDWIPAFLVLAEAQIATHHERAAVRTVEKAWDRMPHPHLLALFYRALPHEKPLDLFKSVERMVKSQRDHYESRMALADAAYKADLWGEARRHLTLLTSRGDATQTTYQMLARLEQRELNNERAAMNWIAKAVSAPPPAQWLCASCGAAHEYWEAACQSCQAFDRMVWTTAGKSHAGQGTRTSLALLDYLS